MSSQNSPLKLVPTLLVVCTIGWISDVRAQDQVACEPRAETLMTQVLRLVQPGPAFIVAAKSDGLGRAYQFFADRCLEESRCAPVDLHLSLFEASLDDTIIALQRQKLARFKAVMAGVGASGIEACAVVLKLETLSTELKVLNDQQLSRLDELAPKLFADPVGRLQ